MRSERTCRRTRCAVAHALRVCASLFAALGLAPVAHADAESRAWVPMLPQVGPPCLSGRERVDLRPDGVLRCPALPVQVTFPTGFELRRVEDGTGATLITLADGGALVLNYTVTTWRADAADVGREIDTAQEQLIKQLTMVQGPKVLGHVDATLAGTERGRALSFTDRQGQLRGEMRTFMTTGFGFTVVALGTEEGLFKPDGAMARAFMNSLRVVPAAPPAPLAVASGAALRLPAGAYLLREGSGGGGRQFLYLVPGLLAQLVIMDIPTPQSCDADLRRASEPAMLKELVGAAGLDLVLDGAPQVEPGRVRWRGRLTRARGGSGATGDVRSVGAMQCLATGRAGGALLVTMLRADNEAEPLERALAAMVPDAR